MVSLNLFNFKIKSFFISIFFSIFPPNDVFSVSKSNASFFSELLSPKPHFSKRRHVKNSSSILDNFLNISLSSSLLLFSENIFIFSKSSKLITKLFNEGENGLTTNCSFFVTGLIAAKFK
jgi:hypothetical protein